MVLPVVLTLIVSLVVLIISGQYTIRFLTNVTTAFGVSEFTVAFIILALATSMPELFVALSSAFHEVSDITLATILGSNIANVSFVIGLTTIVSGGISTKNLHLQRDIFAGGFITIMPLLFLMNGTISRAEGWVLLAMFGMYLLMLLRDQSQYSSNRVPRRIFRGVFSVIAALIAIGILLVSANTTVDSATTLATLVGVPTFLIGLFALAMGTSLPELVTTVHSTRTGKPAMALGNIIGSNISNSSLVIGIASVVQPIHSPLSPSVVTTMIFVALSVILMGYLAGRKDDLSIRDGFLLLGGFFLFGLVIISVSLPEFIS